MSRHGRCESFCVSHACEMVMKITNPIQQFVFRAACCASETSLLARLEVSSRTLDLLPCAERRGGAEIGGTPACVTS